ncbi:ABC transporter permease [Halieaceae bacterium IMCC14734]|uniref:ABC transporter permease n=1 Tax=Candidatus Litorirhabdus singularis TaxID=2518993 RepID=A0ABT3TDD0_9GAMM|nr:Gldg family protein [Candidatus Litorirhabdus singularis]MCX2980306.1 ABC transporter permease [Candidatus Litorirhabdus singularis]
MPHESNTQRVASKELTLFFSSPVAWLFLGSFAAVTLFIFFWGEAFFARNVADVRPLFEWMPILLVFLSAALTMRMWSEERRTGTLEYVLTLPVPLRHFVLGKFRACVTLLLLALLITLPLPLTVARLGDLDWGPVLAAYLATALLGSAYISIGLYVSARSDNPIVSMIGSVALCGLFYLLGSDLLTGFFGTGGAELMRTVGTGARFDAITRGVIDLRDLFYYISLIVVFLALNIYTLERERWAATGSPRRHRGWRLLIALFVINVIIANTWLSQVSRWRMDVTEGQLYSISEPTRNYLSQLQEPLLLRGYFSEKTHPLLAPLVPQLRDLLMEYEVAGQGRVRVEIIDPSDSPELEDEANQKYGIRAVPFQVADRYQAAVVNSYLNILVEYGDSHEVLGFGEMVEVKAGASTSIDVQLRNPEFNITRAIKQVLYAYQAGGNLFESIDSDIEFIGYVSADELLPPQLASYKQAIEEQLQATVVSAGGGFSVRWLEPEANGGQVARQIQEEWGFKPMVASVLDENQFYFYLTVADERQVVQVPTESFDPATFEQALDASLKRFATGFTRTVAFSAPKMNPRLAQYGMMGPQFRNLEQAITQDHTIRMADLTDGAVAAETDLLVVVAPENFTSKQVFAVDQYLMRGGTVILATAPYISQTRGNSMIMLPRPSGLQEWLSHHGINLGSEMVLDSQNSAFPVPVTRQVGGYTFQDAALVDYPYFIDARDNGLNAEHPITRGLPQVTVPWAVPIIIDTERNAGRQVTALISSSDAAWTSPSSNVLPRMDDSGMSSWAAPGATHSELLATLISGRFESFFAGQSSPLQAPADSEDRITSVIERSPESARLLVIASNDFLRDDILTTISSLTGGQYLGPLELIANAIDWSLEDGGLLGIRSNAHFNRTLPPLERQTQAFWEYTNYAAALLALIILALLQNRSRRARQARYLRELGGAA